MKVFWREQPLNDAEKELLNLCLDAHAASVHRDNISTAVVRNVALGSMNYMNSISAALLSIGGVHAPLQHSWNTLEAPIEDILRHVEMGGMVAGWGSSFEKEGIDPIWKPIAKHISVHFPAIGSKIEEITLALHNHGKDIYPNPSIFTAATAMALGLPRDIVGWLFIHGRLIDWTRVFYSIVSGSQKLKEVV